MSLLNLFRQSNKVIIAVGLCIFGIYPIVCDENALITREETISSIAQHKKVIVFDLGDVLITTSKKIAFDHIGLKKISMYLLLDHRTPESTPAVLYALLNKVKGGRINNTICDPYGNILPDIFCEALIGKRAEHECLTEVLKIIEQHKKHFCSKREQKIARILAHFMFDAQTLCNLQILNHDALHLLRDCVHRGHHVFLFSNFSPRAFDLVKRKFPEIFSIIPESNIIVSGYTGHAKPHPTAYELLIERLKALGIKPEQNNVFFLDDQQENIAAALAYGIIGVHYNEHKHAYRTLTSYCVI